MGKYSAGLRGIHRGNPRESMAKDVISNNNRNRTHALALPDLAP